MLPNDSITGWRRRSVLQLSGAAALFGGLDPATLGGRRGDDVEGDGTGEPSPPEPGPRLETAAFLSPRHLESGIYERIHTHRKRRAIEVLLSDPAVNELAGRWLGSFEAYEPLTNHVETVSIQGTSDLRIERQGFEDPEGGATFTMTARRQVAYGLVDRRTDELLAAEVADSDATWREEQGEAAVRIGHLLMDHPTISDAVGDRDWFPLFKGVTGPYTGLGMADLPHGDGGTVVLYVRDDDGVFVVSAFLNGADPDDPEIVHVHVLEEAVPTSPHELVEAVRPADESVLDEVPGVPVEKRPYYTANHGYHRHDPPAESFERNDWSIEWSPAAFQGTTVEASFRGSPVFEAMNAPVTYAGYYLPPREGRSTLDWYFPDGDTVFAGDLLFWDVHGPAAGGPGMLGRIDYPERDGVPAGFQLKSHYHTGAGTRESIDFHSGFRYGPYNYDISYEFFADGTVHPIWRRHGPGFVTQFAEKVTEEVDYRDDGPEPPVVQHYTTTTAIDVTPGTTDGVVVRLFDGDEWETVETEFYRAGEPGTVARFTNPDGPETIDIPLDRNQEIVVVARDETEIGPGAVPAHRLDDGIEESLYHPAQYVDGDEIRGERVIVWLLTEAATAEMPHPPGVTTFATVGELTLRGYR